MQALKAYGGPAGLVADLKMLAEGQQEEADRRLETVSDGKPGAAEKYDLLMALSAYWESVADALEGVENSMDEAQVDFERAVKAAKLDLPKRVLGRPAWKVNPARLVPSWKGVRP